MDEPETYRINVGTTSSFEFKNFTVFFSSKTITVTAIDQDGQTHKKTFGASNLLVTQDGLTNSDEMTARVCLEAVALALQNVPENAPLYVANASAHLKHTLRTFEPEPTGLLKGR